MRQRANVSDCAFVRSEIGTNLEFRLENAASPILATASLLPDEFVCGYRGRLSWLNRFSSETKFMAALRRQVHPEIISEYPSAGTLARTANIDLKDFVRAHTMLPLHRAVTPHDPQIQHGDPARLDIIDFFGARLFNQEARLCAQCVEADLDKRGYAYWRRSHQLPGIHWCPTHGTELLIAKGGRHGFRRLPHLADTLPKKYSDEQIDHIHTNPAIERYTAILFSFLSEEKPVTAIQASFRIRELSKERGIRIATEGNKPTLSDIIQPCFPREWLIREYPALSARRSGEYCGVIDNVNMVRSPVAPYALALAGLFESTVEALAYWHNNRAHTPSERKKYRVYGHDFWTSKKMFDTYVEHAGNHTKIGESLQIAQSNTRDGLCKVGLPALGTVDLKTLGQAILDYADGQSLENACENNNAATKEANALIRTAISPLVNALRAMMLDETVSPEPAPAKTPTTNDEQILSPSLVA